MSVRIFEADDTFRIDGRLDGSTVEALLGTSEGLSRPVKLDPTHLLCADDKRMAVSLGLLDDGAELSGADSRFKLLIDTKREIRKKTQRGTKG